MSFLDTISSHADSERQKNKEAGIAREFSSVGGVAVGGILGNAVVLPALDFLVSTAGTDSAMVIAYLTMFAAMVGGAYIGTKLYDANTRAAEPIKDDAAVSVGQADNQNHLDLN